MLRKWLAKRLILFGQRIPVFRARGGYSGLHRFQGGVPDRFARSEVEFQDHQGFLANLPGLDFPALLAGKTVLDFGSGYGGRTTWMGQYAHRVDGIEIHPNVVEVANEY